MLADVCEPQRCGIAYQLAEDAMSGRGRADRVALVLIDARRDEPRELRSRVVEDSERVERVLPKLDEMIGGGLITLEKVRVILYRAHK